MSSLSLTPRSLPHQQPLVCGTSPLLQRSKNTAKNATLGVAATWQIDPCAEAFPAMTVDEFEALKARVFRGTDCKTPCCYGMAVLWMVATA